MAGCRHGIHLPAYLTRQWNGDWMLTVLPPRILPVLGAGHDDAYFAEQEGDGEPLGVRHLCHVVISRVYPELKDTPPLSPPIAVWIGGSIREGGDDA